MPHKRWDLVKVAVLSPEPVDADDFLGVLLDMETTFNAKATRYRVHVHDMPTTQAIQEQSLAWQAVCDMTPGAFSALVAMAGTEYLRETIGNDVGSVSWTYLPADLKAKYICKVLGR